VVEDVAAELRRSGRDREADAVLRACGLIQQPTSPCAGLGIAAEIVARALALDVVAPVVYRRPGGLVAALEYRGLRTQRGLVVGVGLPGQRASRWSVVDGALDSVGAVLAESADALSRPTSDAAAATVAALSDDARGRLGVTP
jgi:hypothetical protein